MKVVEVKPPEARARQRGRILAIGDIHGCSAALRAIIDAVEPRREDLIITLGDYVNRGPDSRGVIETLIALSRAATLVPLLGNHDESLLRCLRDGHLLSLVGMGGIATLRSYGEENTLPALPPEHVGFLEGCRDFLETPSHIFVHANYLSDLEMNEQPGGMLRWQSLRESIPGPHRSNKRVICGHSAQKNGQILDLGHIVCIDTYCHGGGWLTALDVDSGELWQADREGRTRFRK